MRLVQAGDLRAFEQLVDRYKTVVFNLALSMLRSREDAEEAAQDTFVKLFRAREQFEAGRQLEPWLMRIAGNTCRDLLRRRRAAHLPRASAEDQRELAQMLVDPRSLGREWTEAVEQAVRHEVERLSERLRLPLLLKYLNGSTNKQIADVLGISVSNVKVRLARAKSILQGRLQGVVDE